MYVSYMQISSKNPIMYFGFWCLVALIFTNLLPETENDILENVEEDSPKISLLHKEKDREMITIKKAATSIQDDFN